MTDLPFTFGVALVARRNARDWKSVEALLALTLASVLAQTDQDFQVVIAGHDEPGVIPNDPRFRFLPVDWLPGEPDEFNSDGGMKKYQIGEDVLARGGGLLMLLDADDWVDRQLVELARARIGEQHGGALIVDGYATDIQSLCTLRLPHKRAFDIGFHKICGSSTVGRLNPEADDSVWRNPCHELGSHHEWMQAAAKKRVPLARLPVIGNYIVNTGENHSERHGPNGDWRRELTERVNEFGGQIDDRVLGRFGLTLEDVEPVSLQLRRRSGRRSEWAEGDVLAPEHP